MIQRFLVWLTPDHWIPEMIAAAVIGGAIITAVIVSHP